MSDFQSYLDKALKNLDVNATKKEDDSLQMIDYDIAKEISELLVSVRKELNISQKQLSQKTGIPQANISKIENGKYLPSLLILKRLCDGLGKKLVVDFVDFEENLED
ncbi:MAG: helix-turn-helix transcriptional regulator [Clostridia bacterium]|nr:helix-turn-helix transcriptional regulator [Clostridia bacterium]MBQ9714550.1 helix-turn-helix transcriptional regulator [Clostridia bacterium]